MDGRLANSLFIGAISTIVATLAGTLAAIGIQQFGLRLKPLSSGMLVLPLAVPIVIVAVAAFYFFASAALGRHLYQVSSYAHGAGAALRRGHGVATLQGFDPNLDARRSEPWGYARSAFRTVTLPIICPASFPARLFAFVTSFDETVVALFLATPTQRTLPRQIFSGVARKYQSHHHRRRR